ncbi:MAG TPA: acyl-CoA synthetase [Usitatibacter sp.]|nr:acyl-CoA synthetase [Usitatibacter sp.]
MSTQWRERAERGSGLAVHLIIHVALRGGRGICRALLVPVCAYFLLTAPQARAASREFLARALGRPARLREIFAHLYCFATTLLDRVYLLGGRRGSLDIEVEGERILRESLALGRGCLLLGSHLGSFEVLGVMGSVERRLPINVVMNVHPGSRIHALVARMAGGLPYRVIALGSPGAMMAVRECLERGEIVGLLADRVYGSEQTCELPFLGSPARFSLAPYQLAAITGAPVVMAYGIFLGANRYRVSFAALAQRIERDRREPLAAILPCARRYVESLEAQARAAPLNWFNFYDYWERA